jgi:glycosyltransferase involved in cell wall biosynthesis
MNTSHPKTRSLAYLSLEAPVPGQAAHTHIHEMINELRLLGWQITPYLAERTGASRNAGYLTRLLEYISLQWRLARALKSYDAVYMRCHFMAAPIALYAKWRNIKVVQEINGKPADISVTYRWTRTIAPLISALYRIQMARADQLLPVTDGLSEWAIGFAGHDRVTIIPNAANTKLFKPDGETADSLPTPYVVFVGGLVAWHGISTMIAATRSREWPQGVSLVIAGDGIEREAVSKAAQNNPEIVMLGRQPYENIPALLRGSLAALCVISDPDGRSATGVAPLKLYEAMACAVPVIVSNLPFQADLVRDNIAGLVISVDDSEELAQAVRQLASAPNHAALMGRNGAAYVAQHGSWAVRAKQVDAVLTGLSPN